MRKWFVAALVTFGSMATSNLSFAWDFDAQITVKKAVALNGVRGTVQLLPNTMYEDVKIDVHPVLKRITVRIDGTPFRFKFHKPTKLPKGWVGTTTLPRWINGQDVDLKFEAKLDTQVAGKNTVQEDCVLNPSNNTYGKRDVVRRTDKTAMVFTLTIGEDRAEIRGAEEVSEHIIVESVGGCH